MEKSKQSNEIGHDFRFLLCAVDCFQEILPASCFKAVPCELHAGMAAAQQEIQVGRFFVFSDFRILNTQRLSAADIDFKAGTVAGDRPGGGIPVFLLKSPVFLPEIGFLEGQGPDNDDSPG